MTEIANQIVVVLGMHRSGTSAVTRGLQALNVELGESLIGAGSDNERGFWEDSDITEFNEGLQTALGYQWYGSTVIDESAWPEAVISKAKESAIALLSDKIDSRQVFAFKDPRTSVLLSFWKQVFKEMGVKAHYLIVVRNPMDVAASLKKRNELPIEKSLWLWATSLMQSLWLTNKESRLVVGYDEILSAPLKQLQRISDKFGLSYPGDSSKSIKVYRDNFLSVDLRHSKTTDKALVKSENVPGLIKDLYFLSKELATDRLSFSNHEYTAQLNSLSDRFCEGMPLLKYIKKVEQESRNHNAHHLAQFVAVSEEKQAQESELQSIIEEKEGRSIELSSKLIEASTICEKLKAELEVANTDLSTKEKEIELSDARLINLEKAYGDLVSEKSRLDALKKKQEEEIKDQQAALETNERERENLTGILEQTKQSNEDKDAEIKGLNRDLDKRIDQIVEISNKLAHLTTIGEGLNEKIESLKTALEAKSRLVATATDELAELGVIVERKNSRIDSLTNELDVQSVKASDTSNELERLKNSIDEKRKEIESTQLELASKNEHESHIERALHDKSKKISSLENVISQMSGRQSNLENQLGELHGEFNNVITSLSWRMTFPIRFLIDNLFLQPFSLLRSIPRKRALKKKHRSIEGSQSSQEFIPLLDDEPISNPPVQLVAFYLPQFHAIPENNEWWGQGFTEWSNVKPAMPQYEGHYQPHVPGELGYYDLNDVDTQKRQVELAKLYGVGGFCFYFYWFAGKRLLETPTLNYLDNPDLDLPFCLCWANENWTRTWDGLENEMLIAQDYSSEDDLEFIQYISKYLSDERYIRVDGKPLLIVYRPNLLPDPNGTGERWREWCRNNGIGEIYLTTTQSFELADPREYGFDAAIEFPPNNTAPDVITDTIPALSSNYSGIIYDWNSIAKRSFNYQEPSFPTFRTVNPCWDNTARLKNRGAIFYGSSPENYEDWLVNASLETVKRFDSNSQRLVFVNAWNEWAEGAHLEPDEKYGYAYLQATRNALERASKNLAEKKIVLVAHDAHPHGAQYLALNIAKTFSSELGFEVDLVVLGEGVMMEEYAEWATVHQLNRIDPRGDEATQLAQKLVSKGHKAAIVNTTVSGLFLETLSNAGFRCVSLIHELHSVIVDNNLEPNALAIARLADRVVFPAEQVLESFQNITGLSEDKVELRYQGLYKKNAYRGQKDEARVALRKELGLKANSRIILGIGYLDHRKGVDLFVEAGLKVLQEIPEAYLIWVGHWEMNMEIRIKERLEGHKSADHFIFPGRKDNTDVYYAGADLFVLSSREDPFPSTVMEALEVGTPVIGFSGAGGFENLLKQDCGVLVPLENVDALADSITELLNDQSKARNLGEHGARLIQETFSFRHYLYDLLDLAQQPLVRVSAVVPNYNYARHLEQRLGSIFSQTYPVFEVIVLDDASSDNSLEVIDRCLGETEIDCRLIVNENNSGSVFKQWEKAIKSAKGDFVWICEADDDASPEFLERLLPVFQDSDVVMGYTQSKQIDEEGNVVCEDYLDYTNKISTERWLNDYVSDGREEVSNVLAIKNTIPNVSAVVFRKSAVSSVLTACAELLGQLKVAGDWLIYTELLKLGKIAFIADALNFHRRHENSVTIHSANNNRHMAEIIYMHRRVSNELQISADVTEKSQEFELHAHRYLNVSNEEKDEAIEDFSVDYWLENIENDQGLSSIGK